MIKKIRLNNREIPVPVPLHSMEEAFHWVQKTFAKKSNTITGVFLGSEDLLLDLESGKGKNREPKESEILQFMLDNPRDLSLQTLEAIHDLAYQMERRLKPLAVKCWKVEGDEFIQELHAIVNDLALILELIEHLNGILDDSHEETAPVIGVSRLIARNSNNIKAAQKNMDWPQCSHILLNRIEPLLRELVFESEALQNKVMAHSFQEFENSLQAV